MNPISLAEITAIQKEAVAAVCDQPCQIFRSTVPVTDAYSSPTNKNYGLLSTTVAGMRQPTAGQLQNYNAKIGSLAAWHVSLPNNTDVEEQDRLVISGETLEVQVLLTPQSYSIFAQVLASEIKS